LQVLLQEHGATRLFEAIKLYQDAEKAKEAQEEEDKKDPMKMLEKRTMMSRAEMEAMGNLEDLQEISRNKEAVDVDDFLQATKPELSIAEQIKLQEEEDEALIRSVYGKTADGKIIKRIEDDITEEALEDLDKPGSSGLPLTTPEPVDVKPFDIKPSFTKDPPKRINDQRSLLSKFVVVKKKKVEVKTEPDDDPPPSPPPQATSSVTKPSNGLLGICAYGSGSNNLTTSNVKVVRSRLSLKSLADEMNACIVSFWDNYSREAEVNDEFRKDSGTTAASAYRSGTTTAGRPKSATVASFSSDLLYQKVEGQRLKKERQGLLTRAGNRLSSILKEEARLFDVRLDSVNPLDVKELHRKVRTTRATLLLETTKVEEELAKYSSTVDDLPDDVSSRAEILQRTEEHINAALGVLDRAHIAMAKLVGLQQEMEEPSSQLNTTTDVAEMKLAPIPLPKFTGNIWEWDTFWRSFDYNVHSKQVDEIYKFTYLLQCLEGEAKEAVKQFQVSDSTYAIVINHLHEKYGNVQAPVDQLLRKLETSRAKSDRLEDQLALCEQLSSITAQLELKGEHINNTFFQKQLLSKFSARVQRHVLRQKNKKESEGMWNTKMLLAEAKELITDELKIVGQIEQRHRNYPDKRPDRQGATFRKEQSRQTTRLSAPCFYCNKVGHLAKSCTEVTALNQRLQIMKAKKLCQNCGGKDHLAAQCHRGACQLCGTTGHHTSICAKLFPKETTQQAKPTKKMPARATLTRIDTVTESMRRSSLSQEDKRFLCDNNLQLSISPTSTRIHPQILLGCADLFSLLKNGLAPQYELPSGLQLIPSELGFLVTGRNTKNSEIKEDQATVNSADTETCDENLQSWEDFCTFEANGVDEFVGPTAQERQRADEAVWKMFEQTIEKRDDGYWVRFPWRKDADQLPDNKGLAVRRLQTLLGRLNAEPEVLRKYQDTLQDQLRQGIIEETKVIGLRPSIPLQIEGMRITLNTVTMPPTPELTSTFIGDGSQFALWRQRETPNFVCDSKEAAQRLNCSVNSNCLCEPAENTVNCVCNDLNITGIFETEVENRLPARRPWVTFAASEHDPTTITATMPSFLTAELLVHMRDKFDKTVVKRIDSVSKVENAMVQGCYNCPQGATASISCTTNGEETIATIRCEDQFFTVPCRRQGAPSTLVFSSTTARIRRTCKVTCGSTSTTFELAGILQWVRTIHGTASRLIKGESTLYDEWVFPDFFHIIDVMVSWYKTIILVVLGMVTALVLSYILFWTYGLRTLLAILHALLNIVIGVARLAAWISKGVLLTMLRACAQKRASKKLL
uniref:CCHC-type domain-containing protein n=1 Tax=Nippostrongylus brasiliensis TaxID=27835 RepID=A0A0N4YNY6_NIPBR